MLTFSFFVTRSNRLGMRIRNNRRKSEITLPCPATKEELESALSSRSNKIESRTQRTLRVLIADYSAYLNRLIAELLMNGDSKIDVQEVKRLFEEHFELCEPKKEIGTFAAHYVKFMKAKTNTGTASVYNQTYVKMEAFDPDIEKRSFEDINVEWLRNFETFCAKTACKNARNIHLRNIRSVFNSAIDEEITDTYPFRRFKIRPEPTEKRSVSVEQLREIFSYPVEEYAEIYRDMFKLMFMLIGINVVDLYNLKTITSNKRITYVRAKTHRKYSIKVEPEAMEIIKKYRGKEHLLLLADRWQDYRNFKSQCNSALKKIGKLERKGLGGKKYYKPINPRLSTYWARHTWATIAYNDCGISDDIIGQALGHAKNSVTDIYIRRDSKLVDEANRKVLDWVLYGKR